MNILATITCSRAHGAPDDEAQHIRLRITDEASRTEFAVIAFTLEQFANVLTGLVTDGIEAEVRGLDRVGKIRVTEKRTKELSQDYNFASRSELEQILRDTAQEDGWTVDAYLGSQSSITTNHATGGRTLHYRVYRFEEQQA